MDFLQKLRGNLKEFDRRRGIVKVDFIALVKLEEQYYRLSNKSYENNLQNIESFSNDKITVNYKAIIELIMKYEELLSKRKE